METKRSPRPRPGEGDEGKVPLDEDVPVGVGEEHGQYHPLLLALSQAGLLVDGGRVPLSLIWCGQGGRRVDRGRRRREPREGAGKRRRIWAITVDGLMRQAVWRQGGEGRGRRAMRGLGPRRD
jgi:hypothetical protein